MCICFSPTLLFSSKVFDSRIGFSVISKSMVLAERTGTREYSPPYFNENGSYTELGARMEISKHIILVPNHESNLSLIAKAKNMKVVPNFPEQPQGTIFLCNPEIDVHEEPARHGNNSEAEYRIDWFRYKADDGRENIIWLSRIPPKKGTSKPPHAHGLGVNGEGIFEHYLKIAGTAYIDEGGSARPMGEYEVVPPGTEHYIESGEEGAAFFILIENVEGIPNGQIHLYEGAT